MNRLLLLLLVLVNLSATAQNNRKYYKDQRAKDSTITEHKKTVYHLLQRSWVANLEPSYVTVAPYYTTVGDRRIPLQDGEGGTSNINILEANLNLSFPLFFGREVGREVEDKQNGQKFWRENNRRHQFSLEYNGNFRMTNDSSKPIVPGSHKVGFSYHVNLHNNYTGWMFYDDKSKEKINSSEENLKFTNLLIRAHHYSNGQPPGFFFPNDSVPAQQRRNDYRSGDFSTNYFYFELTQGWYNKLTDKKNSASLHQISLGYRIDLGTEESTFAYSQQQEDSYGRNRLSASYDYRTDRFGKKKDYHIRLEAGYILGNLDNFIPNLVDDTGKYRFSGKALFEFSPKSHRAVGYFFFIYYGRDYLNIRYDDIIFTAQAGFTLSLDKFFMPDMRFTD